MPTTDERLVASPGLGREALAQLQRATVAVVGAGLLGGQAVYHLALLGISMIIVDCGNVEEPNFGNQGFAVESLGAPKSFARANQVSAIAPRCAVRALHARVEDLGLAALKGADLLITGLDSRSSRARVNELAFRLSIPWVDAALDGTGRWLRGSVTVYDARRSESPCYLCRYAASDLQAISKEGRGPCPSWRAADVPLSPPTLQGSAIGAVVAGLQCLYATRLLLGGDDLTGTQLLVECDGVPRTRELRLARNPRCLFDHHSFLPIRPAPGRMVGDLLEMAACDLGAAPDAIQFHGRTLVFHLGCNSCGHQREIVRVAERFSEDEARCDCGAEMVPEVMSETLSMPELSRIARLSWQSIGIPEDEVVTACAGPQRRSYVVNSVAPHSDWAPARKRICR